MTTVCVLSSLLFNRIADILVHTECTTMAPASLYRGFGKAFSYNLVDMQAVTQQLQIYCQTGEAPEGLVNTVSDFPQMFSWFGRDVVHSEEARMLLDWIELVLSEAKADAGPYAFVQDATAYLHKLGVLDIVQTLLGRGWSVPELKLVIAQDVWSPFYVIPNTVVCFRDDTYATYAVMLAHEGTHLATLDLVNDPSIVGSTPGPIAGLIAEALPQAVHLIVTERCGIRYEDLFPGQDIHSHDDYLAASPQRQQMAPMIRRLVQELQHCDDRSLAGIYASVYHDFAE